MARINKQEVCVHPIYTGIYQQHKGYDNEVDYYTAYILNTQDYYPFGMLMSGRTFVNSSYRYGHNGQERDNEITGLNGANYTATFCEYDSRLGRRWELDPVIKEWESPYLTFSGNPIWFSDKLGNDIDPTSSGYKEAKAAAKPEYNKRGKQINKSYEPAFAKIFNDLESNHDVMVSFSKKEGEGYISFNGTNDKGQKLLEASWNPAEDPKLGALGLFEESCHLREAVNGVDLAFPERPNSGVMYVDINDEVRAKMWVANNINVAEKYAAAQSNIKDKFGFCKPCLIPPHYGYIKNKSAEQVLNYLRKGATHYSRVSSGDGFGSYGIDETKTFYDYRAKYANENLFPSGDIRKQ